MFKKIGMFVLACVLMAGTALAYVPSTGIVNPPAAGAAYTNLSRTATLGAIATIGGNSFKCVTNVSTFPAFQGEPAYLCAGSADGYSINNYIATSQFCVFEGIWYCSKDGGVTIEGAATSTAKGSAQGGVGWIQISGVANAFVSGEGTAIAEFDYFAPVALGENASTVKTTSDTAGLMYLKRGGAAPTAAGNDLYYPRALSAKANTLRAVESSTTYKIYLGNRAKI